MAIALLPGRDLEYHLASCPTCRQRIDRVLEEDRRRRLGAHPRRDAPIGAIVYTSMSSPLGILWLAAGERGIVGVGFAVDEVAFCHGLEAYGPPWYDPDGHPEIVAEFQAYFRGERTAFDIPIDLRHTSAFQRLALEAVAAIPYGQVQSYGEIAAAIGKPRAMRAVGTAVATNPISLVIPCHRVIRGDGSPGEYARRTLGSCGPAYKRDLLLLEGTNLPVSFSTMRPRKKPLRPDQVIIW